MDMNTLVEKYFDQIEIEDADFESTDNGKPYPAYLTLIIPMAMLKEYLRLKGQNKKLPDGAEFWKETGLGRRLRNFDKYPERRHGTYLNDILDYLEGNVLGDYQKLYTPGRMRLSIHEELD